MSSIAVVHLAGDRPELLAAFLSSYEAHKPSIDHELVIVANAWTIAGAYDIAAVARRAVIRVENANFDIDTYYAVARRSTAEFVCFVNTYTTFRDAAWLQKLFAHASSGLAGTSASYESHRNTYGRIVAGAAPKSWSPAQFVRGALTVLDVYRSYDRFPNPHVRTNTFVISRRLFLEVAQPVLRSKRDAEKYESGKQSLTRRIERLGLKAVVVGRDGVAYDSKSYRASHTFRTGNQCNALITDNRMQQYGTATAKDKRALRLVAWGTAEDLRCELCAGIRDG